MVPVQVYVEPVAFTFDNLNVYANTCNKKVNLYCKF